ncbi:MAG: hypothetical protein ABIO29_02520 [Sphingomicrobium sp.]
MIDPKPETEAKARRRRWIGLGETIAVLALIISALGLYNGWQSSRSGPTEVIEKKSAIPLVLRGTVERGGKAISLMPVEPSHALESAALTLPNGQTLELGSNGQLDADDLAGALGKDISRKGNGNVRVRLAAQYVEAGQERSATRTYVLRFRWEGGGLFDDTELRFTGLSRA